MNPLYRFPGFCILLDSARYLACGTKGYKIKDCDSKLNIFIKNTENLNTKELKSITQEYGTAKSIKMWCVSQRKDRH